MNFCFGFWRSIVSPWILWENNALELAIINACYICSKHMPYDTWQFFFTFDNVTRSLKCPEIFLWSIFLLKCYKNHSILNELNLNNQFYSVYMIIHFIHVHRPCGFHDWIGLDCCDDGDVRLVDFYSITCLITAWHSIDTARSWEIKMSNILGNWRALYK